MERLEERLGADKLSYACIKEAIKRTWAITNTYEAMCPKHYGALKWGTMYKHSCNFYMLKPKCIKMPFNKIWRCAL